MAINPVAWSGSQITVTVNQNIAYDASHVRAGLALWESVADVDFVEMGPGASADIVFVRLDELKAAFGYTANYAALAVVITDDSSDGPVGRIAYVGLDDSTIPNFDPVRVVAHEVGHAFGFVDEPSADPLETLYSYVGSKDARLGSRDIEEIQAVFGASPRNDEIWHGDGSGRVLGGLGDDTVWGEGGKDVIYGNAGADYLDGGAGADRLFGGRDADRVEGGADDDMVYGNLGADTLRGGDGDDALFGGQGDDLISGGAGSDTLYGNLGADTLVGGEGADLFVIQNDDVVLDFNPAEGDRIVGEREFVTFVGISAEDAAPWWI